MEEEQQVSQQPQHLPTLPLDYRFNPSEEELLRYRNHHKTSGKRKFDAAGGCSSQPSSKVPRICDGALTNDGVGLSSSMPTTESHNSESKVRCYIDPDVWALLEEVRELNSKLGPSLKPILVSVPFTRLFLQL